MSIKVTCGSCGKTLKAKDSAAGKKAKCPDCGSVMQIPDLVYDAEEVPADDYGDDYGDGDYDDGDYGYEDDVRNAPAGEDRRPCPACGEMIVSGAAKCRFCGEIFDATLKKKSRKKSRAAADDGDMTTGDWVVAILCSGIGCIAGIIWMIQGKSKGAKMLGVSLLMQLFWGAVRVFVEMAMK